jgi:predicted DNA-binding protein with PD1-like motif
MRCKLVHEGQNQRTYVVVLSTGDKAVEGLTAIAERERLSAAQVTAIGAFERATLRYWSPERKDYQPIEVGEQVEVLSLNGDIALDTSGKPRLHLHTVLGRRDGSAIGGDLKEAHVRPTLEVIITESPAHLRRVQDPETGLALIKLE